MNRIKHENQFKAKKKVEELESQKREYGKFLQNKWQIYRATEDRRLAEEAQVAAVRRGVTSILCQQTIHVIVAKLFADFLLMKAEKLQDQRERAAVDCVYRAWQLRLARYHQRCLYCKIVEKVVPRRLADDISEDSEGYSSAAQRAQVRKHDALRLVER